MKNKVTPFLWFDLGKAEEAANYYITIFKNSKIIDSNPMMTSFSIDGLEFIALNGGPEYKFNEAFSLFVNCEDQQEVDLYWSKLINDGGKEGNCGWCKDKYGLSWQIIPKQLGELLGDPDQEKSKKVMDAMLKMNKIIVSDLQSAHSA